MAELADLVGAVRPAVRARTGDGLDSPPMLLPPIEIRTRAAASVGRSALLGCVPGDARWSLLGGETKTGAAGGVGAI